jgi:hypothetical protein
MQQQVIVGLAQMLKHVDGFTNHGLLGKSRGLHASGLLLLAGPLDLGDVVLDRRSLLRGLGLGSRGAIGFLLAIVRWCAYGIV